jgi:HSP20 family protein
MGRTVKAQQQDKVADSDGASTTIEHQYGTRCLMAEVKVAKQTNPEQGAMLPTSRYEFPLFGGGLFSLNPFALMRQFTEDMDRMFNAGSKLEAWRPAIEVKEEKGALSVTVDLPGLKPEDVKVRVVGDALTLEGERKQESEEKKEGYYHSERSYGQFYRTIPLPDGAEADKATAQFDNGVLKVSVPIVEAKQQGRDIPVTAAPTEAKAATK